MRMPFSPRRTKRPSEFQVRTPATLVADGFSGDQHDVAEAVGVESPHGSEVLGQHFTVASLQRCNEVIHSVFGFVLDFF